MAVSSIKSTYSLDRPTVHLLESMARRWSCSKSEALRRAIRLAAGEMADDGTRVAILDRLQAGANLSRAEAESWTKQIRKERRTSPKRRGQ